MLVAIEDPEPDESVTVLDDAVVISNFVESSPEVVRLARDADHPAGLVHECLRTGARALGVIRSGMDVAALDRTAALVESGIRSAHESFSDAVARTATELLGDGERGLMHALDAWRADVASTLDAAMDPQRRDSLLARVDATVGKLLTQQRAVFERCLDPADADGVVGRILAVADSRLAPLTAEVRGLREVIIGNEATAAALERSAVKGQAFEDLVTQAIVDIAALVGDVAEAVGRVAGHSGSRVGDVQVTCGDARYVVEVKDRRVPLPAALAEARAAMANREAQAALVVFSGERTCPVTTPFAVFDDVAIVQVDKNKVDLLALEVGCAWARARAVLSTPPCSGADLAEIADAATEAEAALARATAIRRSLGVIRKEADRAGGDVLGLTSGVRDAITRMRAALDNASRDES